jgi:hypothetical protein
MHMTQLNSMTRFTPDAGIAIGPILFIIALLGILAAAIAAGSGSFTSSTANESDKTKAAALIQIGANLKIGMDRLLLENNIPFNSIVIGTTNTSNVTDLFSPTGGAITIPATTMSIDPNNDVWYYPEALLPGLGSGVTSGLPDRVAMIQVDQGTCDQVNLSAIGLNNNVANYDSAAIGDPTAANANLNLLANGSWPALLDGQLVGCINDTSNNDAGYWFYQVIAIQ